MFPFNGDRVSGLCVNAFVSESRTMFGCGGGTVHRMFFDSIVRPLSATRPAHAHHAGLLQLPFPSRHPFPRDRSLGQKVMVRIAATLVYI